MEKSKYIKIEWPTLGEEVYAKMMFVENPSISEKVWSRLPSESLMGHVVISGESMWFPTRIVHLGPNVMVNRQIGDVYFFGSGQSIVITYGDITESAKVNKFAQVRDQDIEVLRRVGKKVLEYTVMNAQRKSVPVNISGVEM